MLLKFQRALFGLKNYLFTSYYIRHVNILRATCVPLYFYLLVCLLHEIFTYLIIPRAYDYSNSQPNQFIRSIFSQRPNSLTKSQNPTAKFEKQVLQNIFYPKCTLRIEMNHFVKAYTPIILRYIFIRYTSLISRPLTENIHFSFCEEIRQEIDKDIIMLKEEKTRDQSFNLY